MKKIPNPDKIRAFIEGARAEDLTGVKTGEPSPLELPLSQIRRNPNQPRRYFEPGKLASLMASVKQQGVIEPIVVRPVETNVYEIVCGERRYRVSQELGKETIPVIIKNIDEKQAFLLALTENIERENLTPLEEAMGYQRALDDGIAENQSQLAERLGFSRQTISQKLLILKLPNVVLDKLKETECPISGNHVQALMRLDNPDTISQYAMQVIDGQLSVRETRSLVESHISGKTPQRRKEEPHSRKYFRPVIKKGDGVGVWVKQDNSGATIVKFTGYPFDLVESTVSRIAEKELAEGLEK